MHRLIAAIDDSAAARPVLLFARLVAQLFGDALVAFHVAADDSGHTAAEAAAALGVTLRVRHGGAVVAAIEEEASGADVRAVVVGSCGLPGSPRPLGSTALALIQRLDKPVVVVPPTARPASDRLHRLLVPLDGTGETAEAVQDVLGSIGAEADLELVALHVFDADSIPAFSDQFGHETEAWGDEFLRRWLPEDLGKARLETRVGRAGDVVRAACEDADFVAVAWKQDLTPGRAQVVSALLADATVPVVLLPTRA